MKSFPIWLLCTAMMLAITSGAQPVTKIVTKGLHSLFLKSDGTLWAMGDDHNGQLGDGTTDNGSFHTNRPEQIVTTNVTAIAGGFYHSLFLKSGGSLWAMGDNFYGELGDGTFNNTNRPEQIVVTNITAIAAGDFHSLFLKGDSSLWVMGYNFNGQLGDGTTDSGNFYTNRPEQIVATNVTAIAAGGNHSLFLKNDGSLWAMGDNGYGGLGDGTFINTNRPEQIVASNVTAIAVGYDHSLFLKSDGSLWVMGYNINGQLGDGTFNNTNRPEQIVSSNVTAIAAGEYHSLFLKSDGSLWVMGNNSTGQLGDGKTNNINHPEQIVSANVTAITAGFGHSLFLKSDGSLWAMGDNIDGQLGDGTYNQTNRPEQIVAGIPGYNQIFGQLMGGNMRLSFVGNTGTNYALDRCFNLASSNWVPQLTNPAGAGGVLVFTNAPNTATNNFWRIRSVP
jgi:alpha-tubulin suppressor-like RCC1 family protein